MWAMLALAWFAEAPAGLAPACLILMAGYVIYDHADGMHARRLGLSAPLGEFLDHYLDAFHGPIAVLVIFLVAGQSPSGLLAATAWSVSLAGAATMVEQRETRVLHFGILGPLEGMLMALAFFGSWSLPHPQALWLSPRLAGWSGFQVTASLCAAAGVVTAAGCVGRVRRIPANLAVFAGASAVLLTASRMGLAAGSWRVATLLMALHGADFSGRVILSYLGAKRRPLPDLGAPLFACVGWLTGLRGPWLCWAMAAYLAGRNALVVAGAFRAFGSQWRWRNLA
jgi:phosphatidylglycerophosphate synthase